VNGQFITANDDSLTWFSATGLQLGESKTSIDTLFVRCFSKHSYICGDGKHVISHTKDERKQFIYSSPTLRCSRGIDVDLEGNIYIVGLSSNNIHQTTSEGKHIRTISTKDLGISNPWVLRFQPNSAVFLLTTYATGKVLICKID
jgi:hypothetical protein